MEWNDVSILGEAEVLLAEDYSERHSKFEDRLKCKVSLEASMGYMVSLKAVWATEWSWGLAKAVDRESDIRLGYTLSLRPAWDTW